MNARTATEPRLYRIPEGPRRVFELPRGVRPAAATEVATVIATAAVCEPHKVERPTRRVNCPEKFLHLSDEVKAGILATQEPLFGPVVGVVVNLRCVVVGPFASPEAAWAWWAVPWNRLAEDSHFVIVPNAV